MTAGVTPALLTADSEINPPDGSDHDVALWFTVIAHALQAVDLGQVMDDAAVVSVHGGEAVAFLKTLSLLEEENTDEHRPLESENTPDLPTPPQEHS